jgi:hypothetical protein
VDTDSRVAGRSYDQNGHDTLLPSALNTPHMDTSSTSGAACDGALSCRLEYTRSRVGIQFGLPV